jgi:S1-C subfamily serine protease
MGNRLTIVFSAVLAVLVVACIGLAVWASSLGGRIGTLDDDMQAFVADTASQFSVTNNSIAGVDSELTIFKTDTTNEFENVQGDITGLDNNLNDFKTSANSQFSSIQSSITGINTSVAGLDTGLASLTTQYSESTLNVRRVYDDVIGGVCQVVGNLGTGSGFIYSVDGSITYIVTCWHVVYNQNYLDVILHDGTCQRATVVGSDRASDVAVLKISGVSGLQPLPLADSDALVVGEPIILIGNPLGIFETVVYGVISRTTQMVYVGGIGWVANLIQYDAAQNPGNSGGPVFNNLGQVVGIAESSNSAAEGIKCAVSSNKVNKVADAIIGQGSFTSCILPGTTWAIDNLDAATAINRGLDNTFGIIFLIVIGVGDVQNNDICTAVDGVAIRDYADFFSYIALHKSVGDTITLSLIRGSGSSITHIEATLTLISGWLSY